MNETDKFGSNGFPNMMKGQCIVTFVELGVWFGQTVDNRFIVAKHVAFPVNQNSKIA